MKWEEQSNEQVFSILHSPFPYPPWCYGGLQQYTIHKNQMQYQICHAYRQMIENLHGEISLGFSIIWYCNQNRILEWILLYGNQKTMVALLCFCSPLFKNDIGMALQKWSCKKRLYCKCHTLSFIEKQQNAKALSDGF